MLRLHSVRLRLHGQWFPRVLLGLILLELLLLMLLLKAVRRDGARGGGGNDRRGDEAARLVVRGRAAREQRPEIDH